ncbi:MAG: hypothetical protein IIW77_04725 [Bacteroidaceae bacterium]|nr:hypothetical protein [Bacteroidaceae bacterium]
MTRLFLNDQEVFMQDSASVKLIKENPYFTKSGSSTYNINIPMTVSQNVKVLGNLNRLDNSNKPAMLKARVVVGSETVIVGEAVVTEITEELVKIQILGGTSLMNFYNKMETKYIDELDLGKWGNSYIDIDVAKNRSYDFFYSTVWNEYIVKKSMQGVDRAQEYLISTLFGLDNEWVAFPVYNETSEVMCNDWMFRKNSNGNYYLQPRSNIESEATNGYPQVRFAIQPYLLPMIKKVFQALGYSIDISSIENNTLFSKIFIASAHEYSARNKSLPHWTVNDFIDQLERFFGVVFVCDEETKRITVIRRADYVNHWATYEIKEVVDEFTISDDSDDIKTLSSLNVGYAETDQYSKLEPWILNNAKKKHYATTLDLTNEIINYKKEGGTGNFYEDFYNDHKGYLLYVDDINQIYIAKAPVDAPGLIILNTPSVHHFRDRIVKSDNEDLDVELKIVPVKMLRTQCPAYETDSEGKDKFITNFQLDIFYMSNPDYPVRNWEEPVTTDENVIEDIDLAINGEESQKEASKDDLMRIAINDRAYTRHTFAATDEVSYQYPRPIDYSLGKAYDINGELTRGNIGLNLHDVPGIISLSSEVFELEPQINEELYCIKFITDRILDVDGKFIIRNKAYMCKRLEYQITTSGIQKMVTGYFHRIQE